MGSRLQAPRLSTIVAAVSFALVWLGVSFAPVAWAGTGGATVVPVNATFSGTNEIDNVVCSPAAGSCELYFSGQETFSGSWDGTADYYGHGHFRDDGALEFVATQRFVGTVRGCGTGSFSASEQGVGHPGQSSPMNGGVPVTADWQVVPGSGSAGLTGLRHGSGTFDYVFRPDQSFENGKTAGTMTCVPPERR